MPTMISIPTSSILPPVALPQDVKDALAEASAGIAKEALAGRLQSKESFNWVPSDKPGAIVPTHGNFAGPGYSAGTRETLTREQIANGELATVTDPITGVKREDYIDKIAKPHDLDYHDANGKPDYWQRIKEADQKLIDGTRAVLELDRQGKITLTDGERNYGKAMLELFEAKQKYMNSIPAEIERLQQQGYTPEKINDMIMDMVGRRIIEPLVKSIENFFDRIKGHNLDDAFEHLENYGEFNSAKSYAPPPRDPLALDLDGDGIETTSVNNGTLFDQNSDGIKTGTGWIKGDDALLVRDLNSNGTIDTGRELFGDQTMLSNGQFAANGYAALADLDSNHDGKIDASDTAFSQLKIWRDANQDGVSQTDELQTLDAAGIASIGISSTNANQWQNGNTISSTGTYTKTDGTTGATGNINLAVNTANTEFTNTIEIPESLQSLPEMSGSGKVRDLLQAAAQSSTLADLLTQYAQATSRDAQMALIDQLLLAWANTSGMAKSMDERDPAHYKVEYISFGSVSRYSHLQQSTGTTTVTSAVTNANNPLIDETYRNLITSWNNKMHILEAFNGNYLGCSYGYANVIGRRAA